MTKKILLLFLMMALIFTFGGYLVQASEVTGTLNTGIQSGIGSMDGVVIAAPAVSPAAGTYTSTQSVSLTAAGSTAICYTTSGSTPACATPTTCTTGTVYSSAISVSSTATVKAISCYSNGSASTVSSNAYTISAASSGGGGGGGGGSSGYCTSVTYGS